MAALHAAAYHRMMGRQVKPSSLLVTILYSLGNLSDI
jgi:hypothetical protein